MGKFVKDVCDDWCWTETFEVMKLNKTTTKNFSWDAKCSWHYCSACSNCKNVSMSKAVLSEISVKKKWSLFDWFRGYGGHSEEQKENKHKHGEKQENKHKHG